MRRPYLITFALAAGIILISALSSRGQAPNRVRRVDVLMSLDEMDSGARARVLAFTQSLHERGWTDRYNIRISFRWIGGDASRARALAKESVELQPDVMVGVSSINVASLLQYTRTIPIVFVAVGLNSI